VPGVGVHFQKCRLISDYPLIQSAFFLGYVHLVGRIGLNHHFCSIFVGVQAGYFTILSAFSNFQCSRDNWPAYADPCSVQTVRCVASSTLTVFDRHHSSSLESSFPHFPCLCSACRGLHCYTTARRVVSLQCLPDLKPLSWAGANAERKNERVCCVQPCSCFVASVLCGGSHQNQEHKWTCHRTDSQSEAIRQREGRIL
jgi:hypothetical protein